MSIGYVPDKLPVVYDDSESQLYAVGNGLKAINVGGSSSYLVYIALLTQSGTTAPDAVVLENTLGRDVNWFYSSQGSYYCTLTNSQPTDFPFFKTWIMTQQVTLGIITANNLADGSIQIITDDQTTAVSTNNFLAGTAIEIRVYP